MAQDWIGLRRCGARLYCEAASPESDPDLTTILSAPRLARRHAIGFADPGRSQNYWKRYPTAAFDDTAIARDVLTVLHDVYSYNGPRLLEMTTE